MSENLRFSSALMFAVMAAMLFVVGVVSELERLSLAILNHVPDLGGDGVGRQHARGDMRGSSTSATMGFAALWAGWRPF